LDGKYSFLQLLSALVARCVNKQIKLKKSTYTQLMNIIKDERKNRNEFVTKGLEKWEVKEIDEASLNLLSFYNRIIHIRVSL